METVDDVMVHLEITPYQIGENTFIVSLYDEDGNAITDARRIRLRFINEGAGIDTSELRPTLTDNGTYQISGTNLSLAGDWRIRMTISRFQVPLQALGRDLG
jgi:hypothetical protein